MVKHSFKTLPALLLLALLFTRCTEDRFSQVVEIDLPEHEPLLAVAAEFSNLDTSHTVVVTRTWGTLQKPPEPRVSNATVRMYRDGNLIGEFVQDTFSSNFYRQAALPVWQPDGAVYRLEVSAPGYKTVAAGQKILPAIPILKATFDAGGAVTPDGDKGDEYTLEWNDPAGEENYYAVRAFTESFYTDLDGDTIWYSNSIYLESFDPLYEGGAFGELLVSDASFNGRKATLRAWEYERLFPQRTRLIFHLVHLPKDKYLQARSLTQYQNNEGNPFTEPVTIHSNIENGVGLFSMETVSKYLIEL
jgi:hypothetical protein